jgi:L-ascorbate metabolism protein UlaG (beta-lactamase superfamily)
VHRRGGDGDSRPGANLVALPSAHETRERDDAGHEKYLGYAFRFPAAVVYHSGDCVPFEGLIDLLHGMGIDLALLPVNGRDAERASKGIAGNFTLEEALELVESAGIGAAVLHHFGMFAFNTIDPQEVEAELERVGWPQSRAILAKIGVRYALR